MIYKLRTVCCVLFCAFFMNIAYSNEKYNLEKLFENHIPLEEKLEYLQSLKQNDRIFSKEEITLISKLIENRALSSVEFEGIYGIDKILVSIFEILLMIDTTHLDVHLRSQLMLALVFIHPKYDNHPMSPELYSLYLKVLNKISQNTITASFENIPLNISSPDPDKYLKFSPESQTTFEIPSMLVGQELYNAISKDKTNQKTLESKQTLLESILFNDLLSTEEKIKALDELIPTNFSFSRKDFEIIKNILDDTSIDLKIKIKISEIIVLKHNCEDFLNLIPMLTNYDIKSFIFLSFGLNNETDKQKLIKDFHVFAVKNSLYEMIDPQNIFYREEDFIVQYVRFDLWDQLLKYLETSNITTDYIKKLTIKSCLNLLPKTKNFEQFSEKFLKDLKNITDDPKESQELRNIAKFILERVEKLGKTSLKECVCFSNFIF